MADSRFNDPGRWAQLENAAYAGLLNISAYPAAEYRYFDRYAALGKAHRAGEITLDDARHRAMRLLADYKEDAHTIAEASRVWQERAEAIRRTNDIRVKLHGETDVGKIAVLALLAVAELTGDDMIRNKANKLEEQHERN